MKANTPFQAHLEKVRAQYKDSIVSHEQSCKVVSCDYGIEQLGQICKWFLLDYNELSRVYRAIEKVLYNLGLYVRPKIKCGLAIRLKCALDKTKAALLSNVSVGSLERYYEKIEPYVKVATTLDYNPEFTQNPRLYFLLRYAKKHHGRYYKGSLTEVFFALLHARPPELSFDSFTQKIAELVKEVNRLTRNKETTLAMKKREVLTKTFTSRFYARQKVGTFEISSGEVYVADPESIIFGDYLLEAQNGRWFATVELLGREIEVLQVVCESIYKKNKDYHWEELACEKLKIWSNRGRVGIFDASLYPFERRGDRDDFLDQIHHKFNNWGIYDNCGAVCWFKTNLCAIKVKEKEGKAVAIRLTSLRKNLEFGLYLSQYFPERFLQY